MDSGPLGKVDGLQHAFSEDKKASSTCERRHYHEPDEPLTILCLDISYCKPLSCWTRRSLAFANSVDPDQLASESALFAIQYLNFYQLTGSSNMTGWK